MVLLLKLLKTFLNGFEILVYAVPTSMPGWLRFLTAVHVVIIHACRMRAERHATSRRSLARIRSPRSAISYMYKEGGRSNISAIKAPVGGSSKSVVLIFKIINIVLLFPCRIFIMFWMH